MMAAAVNHYFGSSIGRKQLVAVTGLLLCGFLVSHLLGNLLLVVGPDAFHRRCRGRQAGDPRGAVGGDEHRLGPPNARVKPK